MAIIDTLLHNLEDDAPIRQILMGAFWTAVVLDTDPPRCGLASTLRPNEHDGGFPVKESGNLLRYSGRELAEFLRSDSTLEASLGMAAFNALLQVDEKALVHTNAEQIILDQADGKSVAIVGHFPFIPRVRQAVDQCWVLELNPRQGDLPAKEADAILPQADIVALTGTSLINHTFDDLIGLCRKDAFILLLGPSAPLTQTLFEVGISAISGTLVVSPEPVLQTVSQGATFRQVKRGGGLSLLTWVK